MTEAEWLSSSSNPKKMLDWLLRGKGSLYRITPDGIPVGASCRKFRLFVTAAEREWWGDEASDLVNKQLALMERVADSGIGWGRSDVPLFSYYSNGSNPIQDALECVCIHDSNGDPPLWANLLREIFGNPFKPTVLPKTVKRCSCRMYGRDGWVMGFHGGWEKCSDCKGSGIIESTCPWLTWNNGIIPTMAKTIYEDKKFDDMPILAYALEEAGCEDKEILNHCRLYSTPGPTVEEVLAAKGTVIGCCNRHADNMGCDCLEKAQARVGSHVRGCWVLDLLLNKE